MCTIAFNLRLHSYCGFWLHGQKKPVTTLFVPNTVTKKAGPHWRVLSSLATEELIMTCSLSAEQETQEVAQIVGAHHSSEKM